MKRLYWFFTTQHNTDDSRALVYVVLSILIFCNAKKKSPPMTAVFKCYVSSS